MIYLQRLMDGMNFRLGEQTYSYHKADALNFAQEHIFSIIRTVDRTHGEIYQDFTVGSNKVIQLPEDFHALTKVCTRSSGKDGAIIDIEDNREIWGAFSYAVLIGNELHFSSEYSETVRLYYLNAPRPMFRAKVVSGVSTTVFVIETTPLFGEIADVDDYYIGSWFAVQQADGKPYEHKRVSDYTYSTGEITLSSALSFTPTTNSFAELPPSVPTALRRYLIDIALARLRNDKDELRSIRLEIVDQATRNLQSNKKVRAEGDLPASVISD